MQNNDLLSRIVEKYPNISKRKYGFPDIGKRNDNNEFSSSVLKIAKGFEFYDKLIEKYYNENEKDYNFTSGNPLKYKAFPPIIKTMKRFISSNNLYKYPYSEGNNIFRKSLLDYIESIGFKNNDFYDYDDIDKHGLSINNLTMTVSTSQAFEMILNIIARKHDVILIPIPNYGLFSLKPERLNIDVETIDLEEEDDYLINSVKLDKKIDEINNKLKEKYKNYDYIPKVVAYLNTNPNNPTGKVMGKNQINLLTDLANVCKKHDMFIIDDLIYRDITYDRNNLALPVATLDGCFKNTISLFGLSKSYGLASLRAGFVVADEIIIREVINRIFREMDAVPEIIGVALASAFNNKYSRKLSYDVYFKKLVKKYTYLYSLLKALVMGINSIDDKLVKLKIYKDILFINKSGIKLLNDGINGINVINKLEPDAGFFTILDFSLLKNKKYKDKIIKTEEDLIEIFYSNIKVRFLMGKSIMWPDEEALIGRFTFSKTKKEIIDSFILMNKIIEEFK